MVVSTHDVEFVAAAADRVVVMAAGEIVADGPAAEVMVASPAFAPQVAKILAPLDVPHHGPGGRRRGGGQPSDNRASVAIRIGLRSRSVIVMASFIGFVAFLWPFVVRPGKFGDTTMAPLMFGALLVLVLAVVFAEIADGGIDAKAIAMLGVLSAIGAALRPLGAARPASRRCSSPWSSPDGSSAPASASPSAAPPCSPRP